MRVELGMGRKNNGATTEAEVESWKISCHEAGHAVVAVKLDVILDYVERGDPRDDRAQPVLDLLNALPHEQTPDRISRYQRFYAGGAAAEVVLFGAYRLPACAEDRRLHRKLEELRDEHRSDAWDLDVQEAVGLLDKNSVEVVAKALHPRGKLIHERVCELIGWILPWDR
jgi:hypothetical protein